MSLTEPKLYSARKVVFYSLLCSISSTVIILLLHYIFISNPRNCHEMLSRNLNLPPANMGEVYMRQIRMKPPMLELREECNVLQDRLGQEMFQAEEATPEIKRLLLEINYRQYEMKRIAIDEYFIILETLPEEKRLAFRQLTKDHITHGRPRPD